MTCPRKIQLTKVVMANIKALLTNDDGVHANGINSLREELRNNNVEVTVIAPLNERSTTGHTISLDKPLRLKKIASEIYGCDGFPADCTLMGLGHVMKDKWPEVVISGINKGGNLGQDTYYSGTVAAAREASFHGVPGIAFSLVSEFNELQKGLCFKDAATIASKIVCSKIHKLLPPQTILNINIPNLPLKELERIQLCQLGIRDYSEEIDERIDCRNRKYFWIGGHYSGYSERGNGVSDCRLVEQKQISVTPLSLYPISPEVVNRLQNHLEQKGWNTLRRSK